MDCKAAREKQEETCCSGSYDWWRSSDKFEECEKLKMEIRSLAKISPRLKVLREMERLCFMASEGLDELRHKLYTYRAGDFWVPTGGITKEDMDIPPVNTVLLVGFHNAGKSSIVNLMYSVLGRSGLIAFAQTSPGNASSKMAMFMEEHNVLRSMHSGFCIYDSRGFHYDQVDEYLEEVAEWMTEGVHHKQRCLRSQDTAKLEDEADGLWPHSSSMFLIRQVNSVIVVANVAEISKALKLGDRKPLEALKQLFCSPVLRKSNENPILILTHGDKLSAEERIDARLKIAECLGVSESTGVYDIVCVTEFGFVADEYDPVSAYAVSEAVYRALLISDRGHHPRRRVLDTAFLVLSWLLCSIASLFAFLAEIFSRLGYRGRRRL